MAPSYSNKTHPLSKQCQYKQDFRLFLPWEDWNAYCQKEFELFHLCVGKCTYAVLKNHKTCENVKYVSCPSVELLLDSDLLQKPLSGLYQG